MERVIRDDRCDSNEPRRITFSTGPFVESLSVASQLRDWVHVVVGNEHFVIFKGHVVGSQVTLSRMREMLNAADPVEVTLMTAAHPWNLGGVATRIDHLILAAACGLEP